MSWIACCAENIIAEIWNNVWQCNTQNTLNGKMYSNKKIYPSEYQMQVQILTACIYCHTKVYFTLESILLISVDARALHCRISYFCDYILDTVGSSAQVAVRKKYLCVRKLYRFASLVVRGLQIWANWKRFLVPGVICLIFSWKSFRILFSIVN